MLSMQPSLLEATIVLGYLSIRLRRACTETMHHVGYLSHCLILHCTVLPPLHGHAIRSREVPKRMQRPTQSIASISFFCSSPSSTSMPIKELANMPS